MGRLISRIKSPKVSIHVASPQTFASPRGRAAIEPARAKRRMKKRLIVLRNGRPIFECPIEREQADRTSVSAAFDECRRQHPELNLFDPEISARLETVEG
jgi:hypothetical protein